MKSLLLPFGLILALILSLLLFGCVTKDPGTGQYSADRGTISNNVARANGVGDTVAPFVPPPYGAAIRPAIEGIGALAIVISGLIASTKNKQAKKATATAQTMATGIVASGPDAKTRVLEVASSTPHFSDVATHLNNATP